MDNFQIETAQNVTIQQNVASLTSRIAAFLIDAFFLFAYYLLMTVTLAALKVDVFDQWVLTLLLATPVMFYTLLFEILWDGQTPGKRIKKIRVVKIDGSKPTLSSYVTRWLLRIIDIWFASGSVAIIAIFMNGKGQRLGDLAASTTIISEVPPASLKKMLATDIPDNYIPSFPQVTTLNDNDIRTIKNVFDKAQRTGNHKVILVLYRKICDLLDVTTELTPMAFVKIIITDYDYYAQNT